MIQEAATILFGVCMFKYLVYLSRINVNANMIPVGKCGCSAKYYDMWYCSVVDGACYVAGIECKGRCNDKSGESSEGDLTA